MIYYLFYAPDIYTCSLSLTKLKFHFILSCRKMCWLEGGMMILPGVSNDYILSFLSPLRKSGTIKFLSTSRTSTILSFSSDYNFASKRQLRNISETHVTGIWYSDLVFLKQQHIQALKEKKKKRELSSIEHLWELKTKSAETPWEVPTLSSWVFPEAQ